MRRIPTPSWLHLLALLILVGAASLRSVPAAAQEVTPALRVDGAAGQLSADEHLLAVANGAVVRLIALDGADAGRVLGRHELDQPVLGLWIDGAELFVAASHAGVIRLDVSDPASPVEVDRVETRGQAVGLASSGDHVIVGDNSLGFDVVGRSGTLQRVGEYLADGFPRGIASLEGVVLMADQPAGLMVVDVSTPASPLVRGGLSFGPDPVQQVVAGRAAADGMPFAAVVSRSGGLQIVDLANLDQPTLAAPLETPAPPRGVAVWEDTVYATAGESVLAWDVSDREAPVPVASWTLGATGGRLAVTASTLFVATPDGVLGYER